jgi:hypothetical protein
MAHLLRGKQAGIQSDLSMGLRPEYFVIDDVWACTVIGKERLYSNMSLDKPLWDQLTNISHRI